VKRYYFAFYSSVFVCTLFLFNSCKKINEPTTIGGNLIPAVDNINTFEAFLDANTVNKFFDDSTKLSSAQQVALGYIDDPKFGSTKADIYFNVAPAITNSNPFKHKDSVISIDSVVLSLAYTSYYGDTDATQTVKVFEISQSSEFTDTTLYRFDRQPDFPTTGPELGSKSFTIKQLKDSVRVITKNDSTVRAANVIRIPLSNLIGERFKLYDTSTSSIGGFRNDSAFYRLFRGLAVQSNTGGKALAYINLRDQAKTKLTVYFKARNGNKTDTSAADFFHLTNGQANIIKRVTAGTAYETNVRSGAGEKIYLQPTPGEKGSYGGIKIPALNIFENSIIHRAELIVSRVDVVTPSEDVFSVPPRIYLDRKKGVGDSTAIFDKDLIDLSGNLNPLFGGSLGADGKYRFNITRYVQDVVTGRERNDSLRLFAPLQVSYRSTGSAPSASIPVNSQVASGRVIVGGGAHPDSAMRMRLRVIYSKIR
jgi:hypothetical protein